MPRTTAAPVTSPPALEVYSARARMYHWITVALIAIQIPVGFYMVWRGSTLNIWDGLTNTLYDTHKLVGVLIFFLVLARLVYRLRNGAPADEPTLEPWQKTVSHLTHWMLYALLLLLPIGGYLGVAYYGAAAPFGLQLPVFVAKNEATANAIFFIHKLGGLLITLLIVMHVGAALYHHLVRKDNVLRRMIGRPR